MNQAPTRQFGLLEFDDQAIVEFPSGLPGFDQEKRFVLVERAAVAPIVFLQSLSSPELCFLAAPLAAVDPLYGLAITPEDLRQLGFDERRQPREGREVLCLALLSASENGPLTANLLAPVVIDLHTRRAIQAVRTDTQYSHQHPLAAPEIPCS